MLGRWVKLVVSFVTVFSFISAPVVAKTSQPKKLSTKETRQIVKGLMKAKPKNMKQAWAYLKKYVPKKHRAALEKEFAKHYDKKMPRMTLVKNRLQIFEGANITNLHLDSIDHGSMKVNSTEIFPEQAETVEDAFKQVQDAINGDRFSLLNLVIPKANAFLGISLGGVLTTGLGVVAGLFAWRMIKGWFFDDDDSSSGNTFLLHRMRNDIV